MRHHCPRPSIPTLFLLVSSTFAIAATDVAAAGDSAKAKDDKKACVEKKPAETSDKKKARKPDEPECKPVERNPAEVLAEKEALRAAAFERARNALAAEAAKNAIKAAKKASALSPPAGAPPPARPGSDGTCVAGCYGRP